MRHKKSVYLQIVQELLITQENRIFIPLIIVMESIRQSKVGKLVQKELAEIFRSETRNLFGGAFITVTVVRLTPDMGLAKVYLSIMDKNKETILKTVTEHASEIRYRLGNLVGKQLRIVPSLVFYIDDSLDYAMKIEELLKK